MSRFVVQFQRETSGNPPLLLRNSLRDFVHVKVSQTDSKLESVTSVTSCPLLVVVSSARVPISTQDWIVVGFELRADKSRRTVRFCTHGCGCIRFGCRIGSSTLGIRCKIDVYRSIVSRCQILLELTNQVSLDEIGFNVRDYSRPVCSSSRLPPVRTKEEHQREQVTSVSRMRTATSNFVLRRLTQYART